MNNELDGRLRRLEAGQGKQGQQLTLLLDGQELLQEAVLRVTELLTEADPEGQAMHQLLKEMTTAIRRNTATLMADAPPEPTDPKAAAAMNVVGAMHKGASQWQIWQMASELFLGTPEQAVDFAEAVVRVKCGPEQVDEERPFAATDEGASWIVRGQGPGRHGPMGAMMPMSSVVTLDKKTGSIVDYNFVSAPLPAASVELRRKLDRAE